jgi:hypothetical protein
MKRPKRVGKDEDIVVKLFLLPDDKAVISLGGKKRRRKNKGWMDGWRDERKDTRKAGRVQKSRCAILSRRRGRNGEGGGGGGGEGGKRSQEMLRCWENSKKCVRKMGIAKGD